MKKYIYLIVIAVVAMWAGFATTAAALQGQRIKEQSQMIIRQGVTIDSLLNRRMNVVDVSLNVADNSKLTVYGKKSENLTIPAAKTYLIKLDSVSFNQLSK